MYPLRTLFIFKNVEVKTKHDVRLNYWKLEFYGEFLSNHKINNLDIENDRIMKDLSHLTYCKKVIAPFVDLEQVPPNVEILYIRHNEKIIDLCVKRLGLTQKEINHFLNEKPKSFLDYDSNYKFIKLIKYPIKILCKLGFLPPSLYLKFFT